jgi:hypothetical protein
MLLTGCGGGEADGGRPVPVEPGGDSSTSSSTPSTSATTSAPTTAPSQPTSPTTTSRKAQVIVVPGNYRSNPAVQGLVKTYPLYFQALVTRDSSIIKKNFPAFFYADVGLGIEEAKANGLVMRPPGSVVIVGIEPQKEFGIIRVKTCRSQRTQYWNPKTEVWDVVAPKGSPQAIDMIRTGLGWMPYRLGPSEGISCARARYPA